MFFLIFKERKVNVKKKEKRKNESWDLLLTASKIK